MSESNYTVITECVGTLLEENIESVSEVVNTKFLSRLISIVKKEERNEEEPLQKQIDHVLKDNFTASDLVDLENAFNKDAHEIAKLSILLVYICLMNNPPLRQKFLDSHHFNQIDEYKLKHFIENIQKRGRGISRRYLDILLQENLDGKEFSPTIQSPRRTWPSPTVYSNSPKSTSASPLRDLLHSTPFQMQKLLNERTKELKLCHQQIYTLETDNQELTLQKEENVRRLQRQEREKQKLHERCNDLGQQLESMQSKWSMDGNEMKMEISQIRKDNRLLKTENEKLQQDLRLALDEKDEYTKNLQNLRTRFTLTEAERVKLTEEVMSMRDVCSYNENLIEMQATELKEIKRQLQELESQLIQKKQKQQADASMDVSFDDPLTMETTSGTESLMNASEEEGNLGSTIIDKLLAEKKVEVESLSSEVLALTQENDDLVEQLKLAQESCRTEKSRSETVKREFESKEEELLQLKGQFEEYKSEAETKKRDIEVQLECLRKELLLEKEDTKNKMGKLMENHETKIADMQKDIEALTAQKETLSANLNAKDEEITQTRNTLQELRVIEGQLNTERKKHEADQIQMRDEYEAKIAGLQRHWQGIQAENEASRQQAMAEMKKCSEDSQAEIKTRFEGLLQEKEKTLADLQMHHKNQADEMRRKEESLTSQLKSLQEQFASFKDFHSTQMIMKGVFLNDAKNQIREQKEMMKSFYSDMSLVHDTHRIEMAQAVKASEDKVNETRQHFQKILDEKEESFRQWQVSRTEAEEGLTRERDALRQQFEQLGEESTAMKMNHEAQLSQFLKEKEERLGETRHHYENILREKELVIKDLQVGRSEAEEGSIKEKNVLLRQLEELKEQSAASKQNHETQMAQILKENEDRVCETRNHFEKVLREKENALVALKVDRRQAEEGMRERDALRQQFEKLREESTALKVNHEAEMERILKENEERLGERRRHYENILQEKEHALAEVKHLLSCKEEELVETQDAHITELKASQDQLGTERQRYTAEMAAKSDSERKAGETIQGLENDVKSLGRQLETLKEKNKGELAALKEKESTSSKSVEDLCKQVECLKAELKAANDKREHMTRKLNDGEERWNENKIHLEELLSQKEKALTGLNASLQALEQSIEALRNELKSVTEKLEKEKQLREMEKRLLTEKEEECVETRRAARILESQLDNERQNQEFKLADMRDKESSALKAVEDLRANVDCLKAELKAAKDTETQMAQTLKAEEEGHRLSQTTLETQLAEKEKTLVELQETTKTQKKDSDSLVKTLREEVEDLKSSKSALETRYQQDIASLTTKDTERIQRLEEKVSEKERDLKEAKTVQAKLGDELAAMQEQFKSMEERVAEKEALLKSVETREQRITKKEAQMQQKVESANIDREKEVSAAREDVMRVQRESDRTIHSLKEEIQSLKDKALQDKQNIMKLKTTYKSEIEAITKKVSENDAREKDLQLLKQKYEVAKVKMKETVSKLTEAQKEKEKFKEEVETVKQKLTSVTESLKKEKSSSGELTLRVKKLEEERQPVKEKLLEVEAKCKKLVVENRSLEAQVKMADSALRDFKKRNERMSLGFVESPVEDLDDDDSRTALIPEEKPEKRPKATVASVLRKSDHSPTRESQTFLKPSLRSSSRLQPAATSQRATRHPDPERKSVSQSTLPTTTAPREMRRTRGTTSTTSAAAPTAPPEGGRPRRAVATASVAKKPLERVRVNVLPPESTLDTGRRRSPQPPVAGARTVPKEMVSMFHCEDEEDGEFNNTYLGDLRAGRCNVDSSFDWRRVSELQRRNSLYPPHMRSAYPAEMQFQNPKAFTDDQLREGCAVADDSMFDLTEAADHLALDTPPASNLRKRKSLSDTDSGGTVSVGRKSKRLSTSYSRPGPPTPGRKSMGRGSQGRGSDKESLNRSVLSTASTSSRESKVSLRSQQRTPMSRLSSPGASSRGSPSSLALRSGKGLSPANRKLKTPSSILKIMTKAASPWRKLHNEDDSTKGLESSGNRPSSSSKMKIFRKPFSSKNYNVLSASTRRQEDVGETSFIDSSKMSSVPSRDFRLRRRSVKK